MSRELFSRAHPFGMPYLCPFDATQGQTPEPMRLEKKILLFQIGALRTNLHASIARHQSPETHLDKQMNRIFKDAESPVHIHPALATRYTAVDGLLQLIEKIYAVEQNNQIPYRELATGKLSQLLQPYQLHLANGHGNIITNQTKRLTEHLNTLPALPFSEVGQEQLRIRKLLPDQEYLSYRAYSLAGDDSDEIDFTFTKAIPTPGFENTVWDRFIPTGEWASYPSIHELTSIINTTSKLSSVVFTLMNEPEKQMWEGRDFVVTTSALSSFLLDLAHIYLQSGLNGFAVDEKMNIGLIDVLANFFGQHVSLRER